jgi:small subunit ribosomal protein S17
MPNNRKRLVGRVVSDKMDKTVVVAIDISKRHRIYRKVVRSTKKIYAHDESNEIAVGSVVRVVESKPLSKLKRWVVEEVVQETGDRVVEPVAMEAQEEEAIEEVVAAMTADPVVETDEAAADEVVASAADVVEAEAEAAEVVADEAEAVVDEAEVEASVVDSVEAEADDEADDADSDEEDKS